MISVKQQSSVTQLVFSRPEKKNAITGEMYQQLADAINQASDDTRVKAIIISGAEGVFTAGNDLADFLANPNMDESSSVYQFLQALMHCQLPLIAAVEGLAVGIGTTLLLHCDRVIAADSAKFSLPFINLGLVPEAVSSMLLPKQVGYQKAAQWLFTGDVFTAAEAFEAGLVAELVAEGGAIAQAEAFAEKLAQKPRSSLIATKHLLRRDEESMQQRLEAELALFVEGLNSAAAKEAMTAFMEKRPADFSEL